jgi:putative addiction module killer protein
MFHIEKKNEFNKWLKKLKDFKAKAKILFRIQKLETDEHFGDCKTIANGIREMRINFAKGYRVYFKEKDEKSLFYLLAETNLLNRKILQKRKKFGKN